MKTNDMRETGKWVETWKRAGSALRKVKQKELRRNYIVVPDGIAADRGGKPIQKPSFVYRQVLDYVLKKRNLI